MGRYSELFEKIRLCKEKNAGLVREFTAKTRFKKKACYKNRCNKEKIHKSLKHIQKMEIQVLDMLYKRKKQY